MVDIYIIVFLLQYNGTVGFLKLLILRNNIIMLYFMIKMYINVQLVDICHVNGHTLQPVFCEVLICVNSVRCRELADINFNYKFNFVTVQSKLHVSQSCVLCFD